MKKYIQSLIYIIFLILSFIGLTTALASYKNPFDLYENPLVWIALIGLVLVVVLKELLIIVSTSKLEKFELEKQRIDVSKIDKFLWYKKFIKKWTKSKDIEDESDIIIDHNYDGIRELDNSLPPWWVYMFYATILFAAVYLVRFHVLDGDSQEMEYNKEVAEARLELDKYKKQSPKAFDITKATLLTDESNLKRGKAVYNLNCASCHSKDGGGGIGPNLTDENWILGGSFTNVFSTIYDGGRPGRGMISWGKTLKGEDIQKVASYVISLKGSSPENPKKPEGEIWKEE